ncbi:AAA family ATPase [Lichenihabitans psoromatis]|uniref:AAA family ATPase n=1 Tax=Lichenihabitans psoromatis TaxID=2528642 RepID=UPI0013F15980|nr:AAA family ATPase [Lichenihabitans psoromatis]
MTLVVVEDVVSRRDFGVIFSARVADMSDDQHGERLRVRANRVAMIGEPAKGETWRIEGERKATPWGLQIEATHATRTLPTGKLIRDFLANHVAGIGHDRATRLWLAYETDLPQIQDEGDVDAIADVIAPDRPVLAPRLAAACVSAWREAAGETRLVEWLGAIGVDDLQIARRLFAILGDHAVERLAANPWSLVALMPWSKVDALGMKLLREANAALVDAAPQRLVGAVDASIKDLIGTGATVIADEDLRVRLGAALRTSATNPVVSEAVHLGNACGALVRYGDRWRAPGCASMEQAIEERLSSMAAGGEHPFPTEADMHHAIRDFERRHGSLHAEQRAAVLKVMVDSLACIQGGAGVGKTYATRAVCDLWEQAGGTVLLAALAGKAALRLSGATGRLARTLFRTLKEIDEREARGHGAASTPDEPAVPSSAPLAEITSTTLVIVDEASMVDLGTMYGLLRRMPAGAPAAHRRPSPAPSGGLRPCLS